MEEEIKQNNKPSFWKKVLSFLKRIQNLLAKTTNGMAIGLFGTLIVGTIIGQFAKIPNFEVVGEFANVIKGLMGAGIGLGVAISLKLKPIGLVATMVGGAIGNFAFQFSDYKVVNISDPLSCYISAMICAAAIKLIMVKKTPVDLVLIPLLGLTFSLIYSFLIAQYIHYITIGIGELIKLSFDAVPFVMCIATSVLVGMALTAPISSVAICAAIQIGNVPLAAGAALIGCSTQMIGFAIQTAHDNKWGSVIAVGIGTSMLQFKNIVKHPIIWLPTIIASAILGPFAMLFNFSCSSVGAGMGTCALVGLIDAFGTMNYDFISCLLCIVFTIFVPAALVFIIDYIFRKLKWIKKGYLSLEDNNENNVKPKQELQESSK